MKICFIAPASNYHTIKWARWFAMNGNEVHIISFVETKIDKVKVHHIDVGVRTKDSDSKKLKYLLYAKTVRKLLDEINPDIINAHYATSYGTVTALSGVNNYILSVWGGDVYDFPNKSIFHKLLLKYSLSRANHIFSTSKAMAKETRKYTNKHIDITPFGVDMNLFNPSRRDATTGDFVIGTVKALKPKYGIDYLLRAASKVKRDRPDIPLKVRIAGKGPSEEEYKTLAQNLGVDKIVTWLGFISQEEAAHEWANMDIGIIPSVLDSESFGVSAVEAEACGTAVIISDIPGLMEATDPGKTCLVVPRKNEDALAVAIIRLYDDSKLRDSLGKEGRLFAETNYEMDHCFEIPSRLFKEYIR